VDSDADLDPSADNSMWIVGSSVFHVETTLTDGRQSILIDTGSVSNLCGDAWVKEIAETAIDYGGKPTYTRRITPMNVCGVGEGSQQCTHDSGLPIAMRNVDGLKVAGQISMPTVTKSSLPGLMGLRSLRKVRALIDFQTLRMYLLGPGDYDLAAAMPPGTDVIQLELGPSGHLCMPCCEFDAPTPSRPKTDLSLLAIKTSKTTGTMTDETSS